MEKKPKLLNKRKLLISCNSQLNAKILEHSLKNIEEFESVTENDMVKFLAKIFTFEPKLAIIANGTFDENIEYARHVRNNPVYKDLPLICISSPPKKESSSIKKKISTLNIHYFHIPLNNADLTKTIAQFLDT